MNTPRRKAMACKGDEPFITWNKFIIEPFQFILTDVLIDEIKLVAAILKKAFNKQDSIYFTGIISIPINSSIESVRLARKVGIPSNKSGIVMIIRDRDEVSEYILRLKHLKNLSEKKISEEDLIYLPFDPDRELLPILFDEKFTASMMFLLNSIQEAIQRMGSAYMKGVFTIPMNTSIETIHHARALGIPTTKRGICPIISSMEQFGPMLQQVKKLNTLMKEVLQLKKLQGFKK